MWCRFICGSILAIGVLFRPVTSLSAQCPKEPTPLPETEVSHCLSGCPTGAHPSNVLVVRPIYTLSNDGAARMAQFLAYVVTKESIGKSQKRVWCRDPNLPEDETLVPADFKDAFKEVKTDRGHQAPLASFSGTENWAMTNYLSNITPQKSALNQGPWKNLEAAARDLAETGVAVYVMTGPLFERDIGRLPANDAVRLPSGYWKILAVKTGEKIEAAGFIMDQDLPRNAKVCDQLKTIDEIEQRSGLDFYHELPDPEETALEAGASSLAVKLGC